MKHIIIVVLLLLQSCSGKNNGSSGTVTPGKAIEEIDVFIQKKIEENNIPGLSAVIIKGQSIVWKGTFGYADVSNKKPFTTSTIINIASISKTFIGVSAMIAYEKGIISLDDDINKYLKEFEVKNPNVITNNKISIRNLATHTSGIIDRHSVYSEQYFNGSDSPVSLSEFLHDYFSPQGKSYSQDNFNAYKPGAYYQYSNIGAALCAEVIGEAAKTNFIDYCKENIFKPLEMNNTGWLLSDIHLEQHAKLYNENMEEIPVYGLTTFPDGGLRTTIEDLSHFLIMVMNEGKYKGNNILNNKNVNDMLKQQFSGFNTPGNIDTNKYNQGIFWHLEKTSAIGFLAGHTGGDHGVRTYMYFSPAYKRGVILITNKTLDDSGNKCVGEIICKLWETAFKNKINRIYNWL